MIASDQEIGSYIADYMSKDAGAATEAAVRVVREFARLDEEGREYAMSALAAFFCRQCGSSYKPCGHLLAKGS